MRKITSDAINAFMCRETFSRDNTQVTVHPTDTRLLLHGNLIATIDLMGNIKVTNAGWATNTTKERLNGIPGVSIQQKNYQWYLNDKEWDGGWITV